ncbi:MAG TPA: FIST N-terminal domain-containing protein, partial [Gemmatimonadaceae bacterium]|nr:FIST N-terminal domain-containing protein [Gemmatimonadaceae bacterium]
AAAAIIAQLETQLQGAAPTAVFVFLSAAHDGPSLIAALRERYAKSQIIGCTTAGEFVERERSVGGVAAMALPASTARAAYSVVARFERGVEAGIRDAAKKLGKLAGAELRTLDPKRWVGILLADGMGMKEEEINDALGVAAPQLVFVGGSAGDDLAFKQTHIFCNGERSSDGVVLMLLDMAVPFTFAKTCSFEPTRHRFTITRADEANRTVYELNGRPAQQVYAEAVGTTPDKLGSEIFMSHPVGMMLDGDPWIRSPYQLTEDGGLKFFCRITEGSEVHLMNSTDLVGETRQAMARAAKEVGGRAGGALAFNCILRRLELDATNAHEGFLKAFGGIPTLGFHTYGESYLGHVNQTCTALVFA